MTILSVAVVQSDHESFGRARFKEQSGAGREEGGQRGIGRFRRRMAAKLRKGATGRPESGVGSRSARSPTRTARHNVGVWERSQPPRRSCVFHFFLVFFFFFFRQFSLTRASTRFLQVIDALRCPVKIEGASESETEKKNETMELFTSKRNKQRAN